MVWDWVTSFRILLVVLRAVEIGNGRGRRRRRGVVLVVRSREAHVGFRSLILRDIRWHGVCIFDDGVGYGTDVL